MSLRRRTFSAGRWTAASALVRALLQILQTVVLARLLAPADFGLMAIVAALLVVISLFADFGISRALIYHEQVSAEARSSLYWLTLGFALVLGLALAALAPVLAALYGQPALAPALLAASPVFVLAALGQQFAVLAEKELRFAPLAINEMIAAAIGFVGALALAAADAGVYALVGGALLTAASSSLLAWLRLSGGRRPQLRLRLAEVRPYLRYGANMVGENIANTLLRQADVFVGGLVAAPAALGVFSVPRDLSLKLAAAVNPVITRVGFPVMARLQSDLDALRSIYLQTLRMTAAVNFPVYVALGLFAQDIVVLLYGARWADAAPFLRVFAAWGLLRSIGNPAGTLLFAVGRARLAYRWNLALLVLSVPLLVLGARAGGLPGLAWTLLGLQLLVLLPAWRVLVQPACGLGLADYLRVLAVPLALSALSGALALLAAWPFQSSFARLASGGAAGVAGYVLLSLWFNRTWTDAVRELLHMPPRAA